MLKYYLDNLLNIVYPKICVSCRKPLQNKAIDSCLCVGCWQNIKRNIAPTCAVCGRQIRTKLPTNRLCLRCRKEKIHFDQAFSPCIYEGVIRNLIHRLKYQNKEHLSPLLARLLIEFIKQRGIKLNTFDLLIPVPLHNTRLRQREFNQAELLARRLAEEFHLNTSYSNLWRKHYRKPQMQLEKQDRWNNIKGCFSLRYPAEIKHKNILLIDDVLTTGATCSEAAHILKAAGAAKVCVLTLAN